MEKSKPRIIKDYEKLDKQIQEQIKLTYPEGFSQYLITFLNQNGKYVSALPFETDEYYYLVRMTQDEADMIVSADEDYDDEGILKNEVKEIFEDKYADLDYLSEKTGESTKDEPEDN
ncbi:MAG: hypothetical protein J7K46_11760 [Bacteroidales bacterium]|nr:hypothetical protein [Bacteroidales bacterium]